MFAGHDTIAAGMHMCMYVLYRWNFCDMDVHNFIVACSL